MDLLLPNATTNRAGARFNIAALREAIDFLDITSPVRIKWSQGRRRIGCHRYVNGEHHITLSTFTPGLRLNNTLWHELTHAQQIETLGADQFHAEYRAETARGFGRKHERYLANRFEVEAREVGETMSDVHPLFR